jgi:hypothetical protein
LPNETAIAAIPAPNAREGTRHYTKRQDLRQPLDQTPDCRTLWLLKAESGPALAPFGDKSGAFMGPLSLHGPNINGRCVCKPARNRSMLWLKAFHVIAMVTWFAGLFYLPRLFVYHADATDAVSVQRFQVMERRLFAIMSIGAVATVAFGMDARRAPGYLAMAGCAPNWRSSRC